MNVKQQNDAKFVLYFEISKKDLEVSKFLYDNKYYPQAIFHLQQAVEKAIKSCGYKYNLIDNSNIAHATWKVYSNALERCNLLNSQLKRKIILDSPILEYLFTEFKLGKRSFSSLNKFISNRDNINKIKKIDFPDDVLLKTLKQHYLLKQDFLKLMKDINWSDKDDWIEKLFNVLGIGSAILGYISQIFYLFPIFSIDISLILFKHTELSRYGIETHPMRPPDIIYTQDHILIKEYYEIYNIINNIQKVYSVLITQKN